MKRKQSAFELESGAVAFAVPGDARPRDIRGEAMMMLVRRGLKPEQTMRDVPFPQPWEAQHEDAFAKWLGHYAFRLFLRGAIQRSAGFLPAETTRYLNALQLREYAGVLTDLGLAELTDGGRYRMKWEARSFGGTLEWYIGRELARQYGFDVATGVKLHARGAGGDLDVVAAAEEKLVYVEAKSSPPRNLVAGKVDAFCARLNVLHPDVALFVVDTALRLSDKVVPMLEEGFQRQGRAIAKPKRIAGRIWFLTPHVYAVNGSRDLMGNIGKAIAAGFLALSPLR